MKYITRHVHHYLFNDSIGYEEDEVEGEHAFEMYGHRFFVHSVGPHQFTVSEESTGFNAIDSKIETRRVKAIEFAKKRLAEAGEEKFKQAMVKANEIIKQHFTPAYL